MEHIDIQLMPAITVFAIMGISFFSLLMPNHDKQGVSTLLREQSGKLSVSRFAVLVSLAVSSYVVMNMAIQGKLSEFIFTGYIACWSGSKVIEKVFDTYVSSRSK